jgi:uncharacterized repeat protein (TIGR02543 family)
VRVPFPEGTARFILLDQNNTILAEYAVSSHAPAVDNISLAIPSDQSLEGIQTITWEGADEDGDGLFYTIEYTPDGLDWVLLAFNITGRQWTQDFDLLPGGETAQIRVTASDGVNSSLPAVSSVFQVPTKGPEVYIEAPESGSSFSTAIGGVVLQGSAFDPQDGRIFDDNQLVWTSDRVDSAIGYGPSVYTDILGEGEHKITLTACNSYNQCSSQKVTVNINSLPPAIYTVTLQSNPSAGGSTSGAGIYDAGVTVKVEAVPNEGYTFVNWTEDDLEVSQAPCHSFVMTANKNLTANFRLSDPDTGVGDVNGDGNVNLADLILTLQSVVMFNNLNMEITTAADVNGDKKIGVEEAIYILRFMAE